ncbi:protein-glutamate O-methyltransferase [Erythrobacter sp. YT30]|nr:protein-glutamate O-methyltransferase [Erythrobacter sp. YT30]
MDASKASYQIVADLLERETGQHLTENRLWRVSSALACVLREHGISNIDQLVCLLDEPRSQELSQQVVEALLNNETYFFRDKPTFDQLPNAILPRLAERRTEEKRLSIWCAGCSTGQEAYSIAMSIVDDPVRWAGWKIDILGTDISEQAIFTARQGHYSQFEVQRGLSVIEMLKHFEETDSGWQINQNVRSMVRFDRRNVLKEPPSRRAFDLVLCRNVLLYFDRTFRELAFEKLQSAMASDGYLMLGAGETVLGHTRAFAPVSDAASLYTVREAANAHT